ncbi:auxin-induced protein 15A-like [Quillaja saponaria]|uniref:Auxin-induced protein 15A-like n=1 Tax=Quillaja saponaria TaxID=32244 RepID=A0AAD7QBQ0_QUISA|nr:auxin-induced protein 15A-like [Quillaja saponaria]
MGILLMRIGHTKQRLQRNFSGGSQLMSANPNVLKDHFAVYVGETQKKRFVIPISNLNNPLFQELLDWTDAEFGFDHPMESLEIPCSEEHFIGLISAVNCSQMVFYKSITLQLAAGCQIDLLINNENISKRKPGSSIL